MALCPEVHPEQNSSVTPADLGLCCAADGGKVGGENTEAACLGPGSAPHIKELWGLGHSGGVASVYTFTPANKFI